MADAAAHDRPAARSGPRSAPRSGGRAGPRVYSIAAHRGFADALVAGLVPRYGEREFGLARLTLLLPSTRAMRTMSEAFIRHFGAQGSAGLLLPRMAAVGDLDLDETLGALLDPLGAADIPAAADPVRRWLRLAELIREQKGPDAPRGAPLLRLAFDLGRTMDRLLVEDLAPEDLLGERVLDLVGDLAGHWTHSLHLFASVQQRWRAELEARGELDAAARRNALFRHAARRWTEQPPASPIVAAGVTSAAPALATLLRAISDLPDGAVVLPDLDLALPAAVWDELGSAGAPDAAEPIARGDHVTHPQYHLKLLLNRMGVTREEVQPWHRSGSSAAPPERSHAISSLFLPPEASKGWIDLPVEKRRLSGVRLMESAHPEEEAQAVALLVRRALEQPERRVAVVTPDRGLAARIVQHLRRWHIEADDSAGRPLPQTAAGRLFLLLAEVAGEGPAPVPLAALLQHPLVRAGEARAGWLDHARRFERALRGPRPAPGLAPLRALAESGPLAEWWAEVEAILAPLMAEDAAAPPLADLLDRLATAGEALCGLALWEREDGRALAAFVEELRLHARAVGTVLDPPDLPAVLREAMDRVAVRPPYGGHPRVAIYGLLESRMTRADLVICAGLNEGVWPAPPAHNALLAPAVLRALGVPGADFRIGLAAHDLAGALGAPRVTLSRARRDAGGPAIPSRFWLRVRALLGADLLGRHSDRGVVALARIMDEGAPVPPHPRPQPRPSAAQRPATISVTALDRLRSDPYQFYAQAVLSLREMDALDAEPTPAWQGQLAHAILEDWHRTGRPIDRIAADRLEAMNAHPLMRALWRPRLLKALEWVTAQIAADPDRTPVLFEEPGELAVRGITLKGKVDRIDRLADGTLAIVDYKTGTPPGRAQVAAGYALQLGTLGLMAQRGAFGGLMGEPVRFEYWSLASSAKSDTGFGYVQSATKDNSRQGGITPEDFLPQAEHFLNEALDRWLLGDAPFTARLNPDAPVYATYDQLMRLDEWIAQLR